MVSIGLWSINRYLRWTGFRLVVITEKEHATRIGIHWYGRVSNAMIEDST